MKKITCFFIIALFLTSCESKVHRLALCYTNITKIVNKSLVHTMNLIELWEHREYEELYFTYSSEQHDSYSEKFEKIYYATEWDYIKHRYQMADESLKKEYPQKYESLRLDILELFNIATKIECLAEGLNVSYTDNNSLADFLEELDNLCKSYNKAKSLICEKYPELQDNLSIDELFD